MPEVKGITDFGSFNRFPRPYREISEHRFRHLFFFYDFDRHEYRQVLENGTFRDIMVFWYNGHGLGVEHPHKWHIKDNELVWDFPLKYYYFGCEHKNFDVKSPYRCYREYTCRDCGHGWSEDSSD